MLHTPLLEGFIFLCMTESRHYKNHSTYSLLGSHSRNTIQNNLFHPYAPWLKTVWVHILSLSSITQTSWWKYLNFQILRTCLIELWELYELMHVKTCSLQYIMYLTCVLLHSHQDSMVLAPRQKYRSMEQNRKPRDKSAHIWTPYLWQRRQEYTMD